MYPILASSGGLNIVDVVMTSTPIAKIVFFTLVICSVASVGVIIERAIVLAKALKSFKLTLNRIKTVFKEQSWVESREEILSSQREVAPLFSLLRAGMAYWDELVGFGESRLAVMENLVVEAVERELKLVKAHLRANLPILANISSVAPFIGLFGTVIGIIQTFDTIAKKGNMGQDIIASGIADALIATAMGLFAAIPAVIAYNFFTEKINLLVTMLEEAALENIYFMVQRDLQEGTWDDDKNE
jgi:biopolymer transport protein ExbB/TolQ